MQEAQRTLRYLIPGLAFVALVALYLYIAAPCKLKALVDRGGNQSGFISGLGLIAGSGGVGYLLSLFHHLFCWGAPPYGLIFGLDHRDAVLLATQGKPAVAGGQRVPLLRVSGRDGEIDFSTFTREQLHPRDAWLIVSALMHAYRSDPRVQATESRTQSISDLVHGGGATLLGSIAALILALAIVYRGERTPQSGDIWLAVCIGIIVAALLAINQWKLSWIASQVIGSAFLTFVEMFLYTNRNEVDERRTPHVRVSWDIHFRSKRYNRKSWMTGV